MTTHPSFKWIYGSEEYRQERRRRMVQRFVIAAILIALAFLSYSLLPHYGLPQDAINWAVGILLAFGSSFVLFGLLSDPIVEDWN